VREKLNSSPIAQVALIAVLAAVAAFMLLGGGGESSSETTASTTTTPTEVTANVNGATATASTPGAAVEGAVKSIEEGGGGAAETPTALPTSMPAPPLPHAVSAAYKANKIVALLIVRKGGIDDHFTKSSSSIYTKISELAPATLSRSLQEAFPHVALFVVPAKRISRYAAITVGVNVQSVPALIVVRPRHLNGHATPQAYVSYGFQTLLDVREAVRDAIYRGPETTYHPN
jgi:hypothetical protein